MPIEYIWTKRTKQFLKNFSFFNQSIASSPNQVAISFISISCQWQIAWINRWRTFKIICKPLKPSWQESKQSRKENDANGVVLVPLLLALNIFRTSL